MFRLFNRLKKVRGIHTSRAVCESLEDRRLLSATGHSAELKLHRIDDLSIVQGLLHPTINIATVTGPGTSAITPGQFSGSNNAGVRVDVQWGSGKSAVRSEASFDASGQPDVVNIFANNPLPAGVHPVRLTLINNGKVADVVKETIRVEARSSNGVSLHAIAGKPLTAALGYIQSSPPQGEQLVISWGDQTQPDLIPQPGLSAAELLDINGTHTYAKPGKYVINVLSETTGPAEVETVTTDQIISTITVSRK